MNNILVLQSDFGLDDGAVSAMYGVAKNVSKKLEVFDLTHGITPFQVTEGSFRLLQTIPFWPKETVFVSVVDPGVGTLRKSVVAKTKTGHFIVTPDNGTLTHLKRDIGIVEIREIDESINRLTNSGASHTFHGRDVYAYTGAKLASGKINFEGVGPLLNVSDIVEFPMTSPTMLNSVITGRIEVLDVRFGHLWTNIPNTMFKEANINEDELVTIKIMNKGLTIYNEDIIFVRSFGSVEIGDTLIYINSVMNVAVAIHQKNFAKVNGVGVGDAWIIEFNKI